MAAPTPSTAMEEDEGEDEALAAALAMSMEGSGGSDQAAPAGGPTELSPALQNLISNIQNQAKGGGAGGKHLDLNKVLDSKVLLEMVKNDTAVQDMLVVHMPEDLQTREELIAFISCPQFRQTIDQLTSVLVSEQMYTILMSMGVEPSAAPSPGVEGFLMALIATLSKNAKPAVEAKAEEPEEDLDDDLYD